MADFARETGSLVNHIYARSTKGQPTPEIGMGATVLCYTDRKASTVIEWNSRTRILVVQADHAKRTDENGMSEMQEYAYEPNPEGVKTTFRKHPDTGAWSEVRFNRRTNRFNKVAGGNGLLLGERRHYHDFSF